MRVPRVIVGPTIEPITLAEARDHLRLDAYDSPAVHPDDAIVTALITVAREWAEQFTGRTIAQVMLELVLDNFPCDTCAGTNVIELLGGPVQVVTSFVYLDGEEVEQDLVDFQLDIFSNPPRLSPAASASWPATFGNPENVVGVTAQMNTVRIRYLAGYTLPGDSPDYMPLPKSIKQAMLLVIGHYYENREDTTPTKIDQIPMGAEALLRNYRLEKSMA